MMRSASGLYVRWRESVHNLGQIKGLRGGTQNVDTRNFDFDYLVLVNLSNDYRPTGMWKLDVAKARSIFVERVTFRKYQLTQKA